jgi:hypothetical protein
MSTHFQKFSLTRKKSRQSVLTRKKKARTSQLGIAWYHCKWVRKI